MKNNSIWNLTPCYCIGGNEGFLHCTNDPTFSPLSLARIWKQKSLCREFSGDSKQSAFLAYLCVSKSILALFKVTLTFTSRNVWHAAISKSAGVNAMLFELYITSCHITRGSNTAVLPNESMKPEDGYSLPFLHLFQSVAFLILYISSSSRLFQHGPLLTASSALVVPMIQTITIPSHLLQITLVSQFLKTIIKYIPHQCTFWFSC